MRIVEQKDSIIELTGVSHSYDTKTRVLEEVSLRVARGEYLGLIGPNGGGKTTLLKVILGLIEPKSGLVELFGVPLRRFKDWPRIGYVSQRAITFDPLFPVTVEEVVLMGRYAKRGMFRRITKEDRERAAQALAEVEMLGLRDRRMSDLSGGQKQRVFLARALASEPDLIVLDEPTTGVDHDAEEQFYGLLSKLNREKGMTLVLVSHDLERVAEEASCVAVIDTTLRYYADPAEAVASEVGPSPHHLIHH